MKSWSVTLTCLVLLPFVQPLVGAGEPVEHSVDILGTRFPAVAVAGDEVTWYWKLAPFNPVMPPDGFRVGYWKLHLAWATDTFEFVAYDVNRHIVGRPYRDGEWAWGYACDPGWAPTYDDGDGWWCGGGNSQHWCVLEPHQRLTMMTLTLRVVDGAPPGPAAPELRHFGFETLVRDPGHDHVLERGQNVLTVELLPGVAGDLNGDGAVDLFDVEPFVLALEDADGYALAWPDCDRLAADVNGDGSVNLFDIDPFVELLAE